MKSSHKGKNFDYISIVKININPEILNQREKTASSVSQQKKNQYSHKKLNSANIHNSKLLHLMVALFHYFVLDFHFYFLVFLFYTLLF